MGINDGEVIFGEDNSAALVGKRAQTNEGMGKLWHHMSMHRCRWKRWNGCESCTCNRSHHQSISNLDSNGQSSGVDIGDGGIGGKVETTGA